MTLETIGAFLSAAELEHYQDIIRRKGDEGSRFRDLVVLLARGARRPASKR
jgi:hypothetical protein